MSKWCGRLRRRGGGIFHRKMILPALDRIAGGADGKLIHEHQIGDKFFAIDLNQNLLVFVIGDLHFSCKRGLQHKLKRGGVALLAFEHNSA